MFDRTIRSDIGPRQLGSRELVLAMSSNDHKLIHLAQALAAMPEPARLLVVRGILPSGYVVVPRQPSAAMQETFYAAARRLHEGLRAKLAFEASALVPCWHAVMERAEREVARASTLAP